MALKISENVTDALNKLSAHLSNMKPVFSDIGEHLLISTDERFADGKDPDGNAWKPLSEAYLKSKRKKSSRGANEILSLDGYLRRTLAYNSTANGLEFGSPMPYAEKQAEKRQFLGISASDEEEIMAILSDYLSA